MALDTYANIKVALQTWLSRADLASDVDDMIDMFEAWCNRRLRVPQMEQEATAPASEYLPLPDDFLELRDIQWQGVPRYELEYMSPSMADIYDTTGEAAPSRFYSLVGDQLRLIPAPDSATSIRIAYWKRLPPLSDAIPSNWLLDLYPDAYLYGPMVHGNLRIKDMDMAQQVQQGWTNIAADIQRAGKNSNVGSLLRVRVA